MEMQDAIKLWKKKKISHAEFSFSCGNDSMDDTDLTFYKEGKEVKSKELSDYFEDAIYDNVEFYDTSDGYYIGESGKVTIELNEDEDEFEYDKSSISLYCEELSNSVNIEITKEQAQFLEEYVSSMSRYYDGGEEDYKKDFILTEEMEKMIDELHKMFFEMIENTWNGVEEGSEWYDTGDITIIKKDKKFYVKLSFGCGATSEG